MDDDATPTIIDASQGEASDVQITTWPAFWANIAMLGTGLALVAMGEATLASMLFGAVVGQWMPRPMRVRTVRQ